MRLPLALLLAALTTPAWAGEPVPVTTTRVTDAATRTKLLGERMLTLQWIGFTHPGGRAAITDEGGVLKLRGQQVGKGNDTLTVEGVITEVGPKHFTLVGTIVTQVSHIHGGQACSRTGTYTFRQTGKRKYFRLKEMTNPCEGGNLVDYVDVYL